MPASVVIVQVSVEPAEPDREIMHNRPPFASYAKTVISVACAQSS